MVKWIWARFIATFLWPLHNLAKILVYKKIHSAIGISKVHYCLIIPLCYLDDPCGFECNLASLIPILKLLGFCYNLQAGISGGGSLPMHVDKFFEVENCH